MNAVRLLSVTVVAGALALGSWTGWSAESNAAKANQKAKPYPLKKCLVSDEELGSMGDAYVFTYKGQEIKLCCKGCMKDFNKEPKKFLKKLDDSGKDKK
jgi:hypothetical protein